MPQILNNQQDPIVVRWVVGASNTILARVEQMPTAPNTRGTPLTQSTVASASLSVFDITNPNSPATIVNAQSLTVSEVMFNTLQGWPQDTIGYNFAYTIAGTAFPNNGAKYRAEVELTLTSGLVGFVCWEGGTDTVYT